MCLVFSFVGFGWVCLFVCFVSLGVFVVVLGFSFVCF